MEPGKHLHIVAFDIPFPADYGGVIDIYYKLKFLHEKGIKIILHAFLYRRDITPALEDVCDKIFYYERKTGIRYNLSRLPYIVLSRKIPALFKNLCADNHPVLLEGLHCTAFLEELKEKGKKVFVRTHNIEHIYYRGLAHSEKKNYRKLFFHTEAGKLERYEKILEVADGIAAISPSDQVHFSKINPQTAFIPPFHPDDEVVIHPGSGGFALYQGNLEIPENREAALFLADEIFVHTQYSLVIAGKNAPVTLKEKTCSLSHVRIISSPSQEMMNRLLDEAQVNVLPTYVQAGIKLKLIKALFKGKWCVTSPQMVEGSGLEALCLVGADKKAFLEQVIKAMETPFPETEIKKREILLESYRPSVAAEKLINWIGLNH